METIYNKEELTADETAALQVAHTTLVGGGRLYGGSQDDFSHVEYAVGLVISTLEHHPDSDFVVAYLEIGKDETGFFVSFLTPTED